MFQYKSKETPNVKVHYILNTFNSILKFRVTHVEAIYNVSEVSDYLILTSYSCL